MTVPSAVSKSISITAASYDGIVTSSDLTAKVSKPVAGGTYYTKYIRSMRMFEHTSWSGGVTKTMYIAVLASDTVKVRLTENSVSQTPYLPSNISGYRRILFCYPWQNDEWCFGTSLWGVLDGAEHKDTFLNYGLATGASGNVSGSNVHLGNGTHWNWTWDETISASNIGVLPNEW